jgi:hypothetical protein
MGTRKFFAYPFPLFPVFLDEFNELFFLFLGPPFLFALKLQSPEAAVAHVLSAIGKVLRDHLPLQFLLFYELSK